MILFYEWKFSIVLFSVLFILLPLTHSCFASSVEEAQGVTFDPDKNIEENFLSYSQFARHYFPQVHLFEKYFTIVFFVIGFPGNLISFLVWSSKRMYSGNSAAVYLAALSLNDTVVLVISLFRDLTIIWDVPFHPKPGSCEVLETITLTVQYASPLFVLAFTVERWLAICQPFMVSRICSVKRAVYICIGIIFLNLLVCSPMAYLMGTDPRGCEPRTPAVFYFTTTLEVLYSLVAPLMVLTFNCLVINEMAKIRRAELRKTIRSVKPSNATYDGANESGLLRRFLRKSTGNKDSKMGVIKYSNLLKDSSKRKTGSEQGVGEEASSPKFRSTTIMLLVVSFYVIFATLLGGLWYVLDIKFTVEAYVKWPKRQFDESDAVARAIKLRMTKTVCDELALSHFAMGFVLYFCTGKNFRAEVRRLFMRCGICRDDKSADTIRVSMNSDMVRRSASQSTNREKNRSDAAVSIPLPAVARHQRGGLPLAALRRSLPFLKRTRRRGDFPGLDQCGLRGERQPSKLLLQPKVNANGDSSSPS